MDIKNINYLNFFLIISLLLGILFRTYNIGFDNLWFDEIVTFWNSDPSLTIFQTFERNRLTETNPFLFNFIVKIINQIFGYEEFNARYISSTFGILSIFLLGYLSKIILNKRSFILTIILSSLNVYLIMYSFEGRVYSTLFFFSILTLIFFIKVLKKAEKNENIFKDLCLYFIFQTLSILLHPFSLIILYTIIFFILLRIVLKNKINRSVNYILFFLFIFSIIYLMLYYQFALLDLAHWLKNPNIKFFTNFYFSKFFGSRLLGIIHLIILISLVILFRKELIYKLNENTLLLFILLFSYSIPLIFGYFFYPVLSDRYIIFVLIPILILLSNSIFLIKNHNIKHFLIILLIILNLGNQFKETNMKQFFEERVKHKPDLSSSLNEIFKSKTKHIIFNISFIKNKDNQIILNKALLNYSNYLSNKLNINIYPSNSTSIHNLQDNSVWVICMLDIMQNECNKVEYIKGNNYKITDQKVFNGIMIKLFDK